MARMRELTDIQVKKIGFAALNVGCDATYDACNRELMRRIIVRFGLDFPTLLVSVGNTLKEPGKCQIELRQ